MADWSIFQYEMPHEMRPWGLRQEVGRGGVVIPAVEICGDYTATKTAREGLPHKCVINPFDWFLYKDTGKSSARYLATRGLDFRQIGSPKMRLFPQSFLSFVLKFVDESSNVGKNFHCEYVSVSQSHRGFLREADSCRGAGQDDGARLESCALREKADEFGDGKYQVTSNPI
jgi:hypothetical protein